MKEYFKEYYNIMLRSSTVASSLFIKKVLKQENIKKIIMIKNDKSADLADQIALGYGKETRVISNFTLKPNFWNQMISKIKFFVESKSHMFEFENQSFQQLKVTVKIGERERTLNLNNIENLSIIEYLPDDLQLMNGHPDQEKFIEYMELVVNEYLKEMVLQII